MKARTALQQPGTGSVTLPPGVTTPPPAVHKAAQAPAPPKISIGRVVNFVMKDGQVRPFQIVRVWSVEQGYVNGVLTFDGSNDANILPHTHPDPAGSPVQWLTSIHFDANKTPGTWHWPERV